MSFDKVLVSASRGLGQFEALMLTPGYERSTAQPGPPLGVDAAVEQFDVARSEAREQVSATIANLVTNQVVREHVPGSTSRNVKTESVLRGLHTTRLLLPAYVIAYQYGNRRFRVVMAGQNSNRLLGDAPYSMWRILGVVGLALAVVAGVLAVAM